MHICEFVDGWYVREPLRMEKLSVSVLWQAPVETSLLLSRDQRTWCAVLLVERCFFLSLVVSSI